MTLRAAPRHPEPEGAFLFATNIICPESQLLMVKLEHVAYFSVFRHASQLA